MRDGVDDLYDYDELRRVDVATMFVADVARPTLVLGGSQSRDVLDDVAVATVALRRRRGGGGLVLLRPGDLWVDWWIPRDDPRWSPDVRVSSTRTGETWAECLGRATGRDVRVHRGPLEGDPAFRVACFAGRGPGEVFLGDRKVVGLTQWRVREGVFVSSVLHAAPTTDLVAFLKAPPPGLADALNHEGLESLHLGRTDEISSQLERLDGPWRRRTKLVA